MEPQPFLDPQPFEHPPFFAEAVATVAVLPATIAVLPWHGAVADTVSFFLAQQGFLQSFPHLADFLAQQGLLQSFPHLAVPSAFMQGFLQLPAHLPLHPRAILAQRAPLQFAAQPVEKTASEVNSPTAQTTDSPLSQSDRFFIDCSPRFVVFPPIPRARNGGVFHVGQIRSTFSLDCGEHAYKFPHSPFHAARDASVTLRLGAGLDPPQHQETRVAWKPLQVGRYDSLPQHFDSMEVIGLAQWPRQVGPRKGVCSPAFASMFRGSFRATMEVRKRL